MLASLIAVAIVQAPTIVSMPAPPAPPSPHVVAQPRTVPDSVLTIAVDVAAENKTIWQGNLRVGGYQPASFNQSVQYASELPSNCQPEDRFSSSRDQLTVTLSRFRRASQPDAVTLSTNWTRSTRPVSCGSHEAPSRTVSLTETISLISGRTVQVRGDGGLVVTLRLADRYN